MSRLAVARGIAGRSLLLIPRLPSTFIPSLVMPIFFAIVFSEAFSGVTELPGFPAEKSIDWYLPMAGLMGAGFAGVTTGLGMARDLQGGFYDRLLASPAPRGSLMAGAMLAAVLRSLLPVTLVLIVGVIGGASFAGALAGIGMLYVAGIGVAAVTSAWSIAIAYRFKTLQAAPLMQMAFFLAMFLAPAQMPLPLIEGWLHDVARFNPMTNVLRMARQGLIGGVAWDTTWPGLVAIGGLLAGLVLFAARSLRRVTR